MNTWTASRALLWILKPTTDLVAFSAIVCGVAAWDAAYRPRFFDEGYALALIFQMFCASSGFRERAVRGHFDPLLTRAHRANLAAAHFAASTSPGVLLWLAVALIDAIAFRRLPAGTSPGALAALCCVSAIAWSAGLALPRYGAAILWLAVGVTIAGSGLAGRIHAGSLSSDPLTEWIGRTLGFFGAPVLLVGTPASWITLASVLAGTVLAACAGAIYVVRFDAALQELT